MEGWIKLYRQIQECDFLWSSKDEPFDRRSAWVDLLLMANHRDKRLMFRGKAITVKCGQRITSMRDLAERWHWSRDKVRRYLDLLEGEEMIIRESDNHKTLLTIVNYAKFQGECATDKSTDKSTDEPQTSPQTGHRQVTNKNEKNDKNEKNIYGEYRHVKLTDQEHEKLVSEYGWTMAKDLIKYLDEYIEMKGYKAKSHYLCIKKWVVDALKNNRGKKGFNAGEGSSDADEFIRRMGG